MKTRALVAIGLVAALSAVAVYVALQARDTPNEVVPSLIGLTESRASAVLAPLGLSLDVVRGDGHSSDSAVLNQSPVAGLPLGSFKTVRVAFEGSSTNVPESDLTRSMAEFVLRDAIAKLAAERTGPWQPVEIQLSNVNDKGAPCVRGPCTAVVANTQSEGAVVYLDSTTNQSSMTWSEHPIAPARLSSDDELVAAALNDPTVGAILAGRAVDAFVCCGSGSRDPPCLLPNGIASCVNVFLLIPGLEAGIVSVNYVTLEVRLDRPPGLEGQAQPSDATHSVDGD